MLPTFNTFGDFVLIEYISWKWRRKLELGDIVAAISPLNPHRAICKRVLGLVKLLFIEHVESNSTFGLKSLETLS